VQEDLRVEPNVFAAGDAAAFSFGGRDLRMGVQFGISMGRAAAENILRLSREEPTRAFAPWNPGYLIPMAHGKACGVVLGKTLYGRLPLLLHYGMCIFRSLGMRNRAIVFRDLLRSVCGRTSAPSPA